MRTVKPSKKVKEYLSCYNLFNDGSQIIASGAA